MDIKHIKTFDFCWDKDEPDMIYWHEPMCDAGLIIKSHFVKDSDNTGILTVDLLEDGFISSKLVYQIHIKINKQEPYKIFLDNYRLSCDKEYDFTDVDDLEPTRLLQILATECGNEAAQRAMETSGYIVSMENNNLVKKYKDGSIEVLGKLASSKDLKIPKTFKIKA